MPLNPDIIFSFYRSSESAPEDWLGQIKESSLRSFEVPGEFFESESFEDFYFEVFKAGKSIVSVKNVLPSSLARNLASCGENIKKDVINILKSRLDIASRYNIKYVNFDLGLDSIKTGFEIQEITVRAQIIQHLLKIADQTGITLLHPFRFPKSFPGSQEWKFSTMLASSVMHSNFQTEINIFPNEASITKAENLLKKTYYTSALIRFMYDPSMGSRLSSNMHDSWNSTLKSQGFTGDIIFSPKVSGLEMLKQEVEQISKAAETYAGVF